MSSPVYDAVVVGGGIVGAACALECSTAGLNVALVEEGCIGGGATAAGMGHIVVMDDSEAQFALTRFSQVLWRQLSSELPANCEYVETGTLWIAADESEMEEVRRKHGYYSSRGVPTAVLSARELAGLEPNLRTDCTGALLVTGDAVVYPPCVASYLLTLAQAKGTSVVRGEPVERIDDSGVWFRNGTVLQGGAFINAAGSRAARLTKELPVAPRKGHLVITDRYPAFARHQLVELGYLKSAHKTGVDSVAFNVQPRKTGQLLIGSSRQFGPEDPAIDSGMLARMLDRAVAYMPGLASLSAIRVWTGFRAATPDKLPLIGPVPGYRRVLAATGHEGLGITTSLGTARLLVDGLLGRRSVICPEPYLAAREIAAHA